MADKRQGESGQPRRVNRCTDGLEKSFLQMVGTEVRRVGVDASRDVFRAEGVERLNDYLIDDAEVEVFNQKDDLLFVARKLNAEGEVDFPRSIEDDLQLLFGKLVVVDFHKRNVLRVKRNGEERVKEGLTLLRCLELEAFIDVLRNRCSVTSFEQVHITHSTLGCLAAASHVIFRGYALEIDVPAVELAGCDDELGICSSCCFDCGGNVCCDVLG